MVNVGNGSVTLTGVKDLVRECSTAVRRRTSVGAIDEGVLLLLAATRLAPEA
jgi:hypothetical protein